MLDQGRVFETNGAVIVEDIIARRPHCDTKTNNTGQRVLNWAKENGWTVPGPEDYTYRARTRISTPDIMLSKCMQQHEVEAMEQY